MNRVSVLAFAALTFLSACATAQRAGSAPLRAARVAVLPAHNKTKDPEGAELLRQLVQRWIAQRGYVTVPASLIDQEFKTEGLKDVSEMTTEKTRLIAEKFNADAVAFVDVIDFMSVNRGFSHERRIAASVKLVDSKTGATLWQNTDSVTEKGSTINPTKAVYDYIKQWTTEQMGRFLRSPLYADSDRLVQRLISTLPPYSPAI